MTSWTREHCRRRDCRQLATEAAAGQHEQPPGRRASYNPGAARPMTACDRDAPCPADSPIRDSSREEEAWVAGSGRMTPCCRMQAGRILGTQRLYQRKRTEEILVETARPAVGRDGHGEKRPWRILQARRWLRTRLGLGTRPIEVDLHAHRHWATRSRVTRSRMRALRPDSGRGASGSRREEPRQQQWSPRSRSEAIICGLVSKFLIRSGLQRQRGK
eukprot:653944-Hanusia_phi.AAC.1